MNRRDFLRATALGAPAFVLPPLFAQDSKDGPFQEITPEQVQAVDRGLAWLSKAQTPSGAIGGTSQVAFTSLAGLAFMANNSTPFRGRYARQVRNCLKFILRCCAKTGYVNEGGLGRSTGGSGMHGHGYATWFLAELYGMCGDMLDLGDDSVKEKLQLAVKVIESSQDPTGGWTYEPQPYGHEGSVTVTQVQALRSARNSGILADKKVIDRGMDYIRRSSYADGTIAYSLNSRGSGGTYALTAAGMCVFAMYGLYDVPEVKKGMQAIMDFLSGSRARGGQHDYYAHLYAGQVCFFAKRQDPMLWKKGYTAIRRELLGGNQDKSGCWAQDGYSGAFGTACATIVLQIPYRYLPIFQD